MAGISLGNTIIDEIKHPFNCGKLSHMEEDRSGEVLCLFLPPSFDHHLIDNDVSKRRRMRTTNKSR